MSQRDCGWIQLYAGQSGGGRIACPGRLAEQVSVPVMVCVDGFILPHAFEPIEVPDQSIADAYLPRYQPRQQLTPVEPVTIGAMVAPEASGHNAHQHGRRGGDMVHVARPVTVGIGHRQAAAANIDRWLRRGVPGQRHPQN